MMMDAEDLDDDDEEGEDDLHDDCGDGPDPTDVDSEDGQDDDEAEDDMPSRQQRSSKPANVGGKRDQSKNKPTLIP